MVVSRLTQEVNPAEAIAVVGEEPPTGVDVVACVVQTAGEDLSWCAWHTY